MKINKSYKKMGVDSGLTMLEEGLTVGTQGNISVRDPETGLIYISLSGMDLPAISEDFAQIVGDKIICSKYALPRTKELRENVAMGLGEERNAVLLPIVVLYALAKI